MPGLKRGAAEGAPGFGLKTEGEGQRRKNFPFPIDKGALFRYTILAWRCTQAVEGSGFEIR